MSNKVHTKLKTVIKKNTFIAKWMYVRNHALWNGTYGRSQPYKPYKMKLGFNSMISL